MEHFFQGTKQLDSLNLIQNFSFKLKEKIKQQKHQKPSNKPKWK